MTWLDRETLMVARRLRETTAGRRVCAPYRGPQGWAVRDADHARLSWAARGRHHAGYAGAIEGRSAPRPGGTCGRTVQVMRMPMRKEERKEGCHGR